MNRYTKLWLMMLSIVGGGVLLLSSSALAASTPEGCFDFDSWSNTLISYLTGDGAGNTCPTDVEIPAQIGWVDVIYIGDNFHNRHLNSSLPTLTSLVLPEGLKKIGYEAFHSNKITTLTFPHSLKEIGPGAFNFNELTGHLVIPDTIETIGNFAFAANFIQSIDIGSWLRYLQMRAFEYNKLTELTIPSNIEQIQQYAFERNLLTKIVFQRNGSTTIQTGAFDVQSSDPISKLSNETDNFYGAWNKTDVGSGDYERVLQAASESCFEFDTASNTLLSYYTGDNVGDPCPTAVVIPAQIGGEDVLHIGDGFHNRAATTAGDPTLPSITSLMLPEWLLSIGIGAFDSNDITDLIIPGSVLQIWRNAFAFNKISSLSLWAGVQTIGQWAFWENDIAGQLVIPDSVKTIDKQSFVFNKISSLSLWAGVELIGLWAFCNNNITWQIVIPQSIQAIQSNAFCNNYLTQITFKRNWSTSIGINAFNEQDGDDILWLGYEPGRYSHFLLPLLS